MLIGLIFVLGACGGAGASEGSTPTADPPEAQAVADSKCAWAHSLDSIIRRLKADMERFPEEDRQEMEERIREYEAAKPKYEKYCTD